MESCPCPDPWCPTRGKHAEDLDEAAQEEIDCQDCGCAVANGLILKARRIDRRTCSECGHQVGSQHFCWGTTAG